MAWAGLARFQDPQLEFEYVSAADAAQVPMDLATSVIGVMYSTVLTRKALEIEGLKASVVHAVLTALYFGLPLIMIWRNRQSYAAVRQQYALTGLPSLCYFGGRAAEVLTHVPSAGRLLPLLFLLRSQLPMLFWANMSIRLPIRRHLVAHGLALLVSTSFNKWRCRWALEVAPWLQPVCAQLAGRLSRLALVAPLKTRPVRAGEECLVLLTFLQLTLGYLLPSFITLTLELHSRRRFLQQRRTAPAQQQGGPAPSQQGAGQPLQPRLPPAPRWISWHLPWQAALVAALAWHIVVAGLDWLRPA